MAPPTPEQLVEILRRPLEELPDPLELVPVPGPFDVTIRPPGSKSLMNRALLLAALAEGKSEIENPLLDAQDAQVMIRALEQLGARIEMPSEPGGPLVVHGTAGKLTGGCALDLESAGTATRFLTAAACLADGPVVIDGSARMRQRPIGELIELLRELGVMIDELGEPGCVPLRVHPHRPAGGEIEIGATQSSQFISALMMIGPFMASDLKLRYMSAPTSESYIDMTAWAIERFGVETWMEYSGTPEEPDYRRESDEVSLSKPQATDFFLEPDATGASYFLAAAASVSGSRTVIRTLDAASPQGDACFIESLWLTGANVRASMFDFAEGFDELDRKIMAGDLVDPKRLERFFHEESKFTEVRGARTLKSGDECFALMPDTAQTLAAVACFADGTTTIRGLRTLRVKETDRIAAIQTELAKIGVKVEAFTYTNEHDQPDEGVTITPPSGGVDCSESAPPVVFDTYDDHRMAMSLALIGLRRPNVSIRDPGCVRKTYPTFWRDWSLLYDSALAGGEPMGPKVE